MKRQSAKDNVSLSKYESLRTIKSTQIELCELRGYNVPIEEKNAVKTIASFVKYIGTLSTKNKGIENRSLMTKIYEKDKDKKESLLVFYATKSPDQKLVSIISLQPFIDTIRTKRIKEAILVLEVPLSPTAATELNAIKLTKLQIFQDLEFFNNPINNVHTQRHELVPSDEVDMLLKEMKVKLSQLMIIKANDPVVKFYGWGTGNLVRIHRHDDVISLLDKRSINYKVIFD
jgi:DNA-directed RNA polymerase subunit H (RpoH/RPB5)